MAEIFFLTRGHLDHIEKFIHGIRSQWFPFKTKKKLKDENGNEIEVEVSSNIDGQLRPYQLWGYVCPEEFVQPLCNNLGIPTEETYFDKEAEKGGNSFISGKGIKFQLEAMRLALGAEKLPKIDLTKGVWNQPIYHDHINILGIGWRPDLKGKTTAGEHELI